MSNAEQQFNQNMQKMFSKLQENILLVRRNYLDNWGANETTGLLFALGEICELMSEDYGSQSNEADQS